MKILMTPKMRAVTTMVRISGVDPAEARHEVDRDGQRDRVGSQADELLHDGIVQPVPAGTMAASRTATAAEPNADRRDHPPTPHDVEVR